MKVNKKNKGLLMKLYLYKALYYGYFALFISVGKYEFLFEIMLIMFLFGFTWDSWKLIRDAFRLSQQEKD